MDTLTVGLFLTIMTMAIIMEGIDSALGMMYGTIMSPILVLMGGSPSVIVPAITLSQAAGGLIATLRHNSFKNGDFSSFRTRDFKVVLAIVIPGLLAVTAGVIVALKVPAVIYNWYLGVLVIAMGVLCIRPFNYTFRWWKIYLIGIVSSFNKAMSGGGFGPVTSTGKILGGLGAKVSVATTTFAEVPICIASFIIWAIMKGGISWALPICLITGSIIGGYIGPYITFKFNTRWLKIGVGALAIISGLLVIILQKST